MRIFRWFADRRKRGTGVQWQWSFVESQQTLPQGIQPQITYPQPLSSRSVDEPKGKVVLGFRDGSEVVLQNANPLVHEFIRAADRMMRPARWRKISLRRGE